jgi:hypothetical protein
MQSPASGTGMATATAAKLAARFDFLMAVSPLTGESSANKVSGCAPQRRVPTRSRQQCAAARMSWHALGVPALPSGCAMLGVAPPMRRRGRAVSPSLFGAIYDANF